MNSAEQLVIRRTNRQEIEIAAKRIRAAFDSSIVATFDAHRAESQLQMIFETYDTGDVALMAICQPAIKSGK